MDPRSKFQFGLEAEFFLMERASFEPLWFSDLQFKKLDMLLGGISLQGIESCQGLLHDPPHSHCSPYVVEGYHLYDSSGKPRDLQPKGVEIRTPICCSIQRCLDNYQRLFARMQEALVTENYLAVAISHHPRATAFEGEQAMRSSEFWRWAKEAMMTYGPDINISLPAELLQRMNFPDFFEKVNYYSPALTALTVSSPFAGGELWKIHGDVGKSYRTHRRSLYAPAIKVHSEDEGHRIEFKFFEMSSSLTDFEAYFLMCLTLLLSEDLKGRSDDADRVYELGKVARWGLEAEGVAQTLEEFFAAAYRVLPAWGFGTAALDEMVQRLEKRWTPADQMIEQYLSDGHWKKIFLDHSRLKHNGPSQ